MHNTTTLRALTLAAVLGVASTCTANDSSEPSDWDYGATVYLWGANITARTPASDPNIPFYKLLDNLKMAFMGNFSARKGRWSVGADLIYMKVNANESSPISLPGGGTGEARNDVGLKSWIITPHLGYALHESDEGSFDLVGGVRYLDLTASASVSVQDIRVFDREQSGANWDAVVGVRGVRNLNENWYLRMYADIGTGDSESTWQAMAGVGYRFNSFDLTVAYRYLDYDFKDHRVLNGMTMKGPVAGLTFVF